MLKTTARTNQGVIFLLLLLAWPFCLAGAEVDKSKYITVDEIRPGMQAYCLTTYKGTGVEKFEMEVIDVARKAWGDRDAILVQGTDERFIRTGPVAGCSGSPVYIDGRLAGALAFGFFFSKDPLYGVTPIEDMLKAGTGASNRQSGRAGFVFDLSKPLDFAQIDKQLTDTQYGHFGSRMNQQYGVGGLEPLPCPLIASGLPGQVVEQIDGLVRPLGFMVAAGMGTAGPAAQSSGPVPRYTAGQTSSVAMSEKTGLVPGAPLAVPLLAGDMRLDAIGTVTEVIGDKLYGFGHSFLGYGPVELPMATGYVYTVVSNLMRSFKFASSVDIVGTLTTDEASAVVGQLGAKPRMIPLKMKVDRYNDPETKVYNCRLANNQLLTPLIVRWAILGGVLSQGMLPPEHTLAYKANITLDGAKSIRFENISTGAGAADMMMELTAVTALLMNNPFKTVNIESIETEVRIEQKSTIAHLWSVELSDSTVKAGEEAEITSVVESYLSDKKMYRARIKLPEDLPPGKYGIVVCGGYNYLQFLRKVSPYKFIPQNLPDLIEALNEILSVKRDKLYYLLLLPPGGLSVERAELPDLPPTKALIFQDAKRTLSTQPYQRWVEKSLSTDTVIIDQKMVTITVEK